MYQLAGQAVEDPNTNLQEVVCFSLVPTSLCFHVLLFPESPSSHISSFFSHGFFQHHLLCLPPPVNAPVPRLQHYLPISIILVAIVSGIYLPLH